MSFLTSLLLSFVLLAEETGAPQIGHIQADVPQPTVSQTTTTATATPTVGTIPATYVSPVVTTTTAAGNDNSGMMALGLCTSMLSALMGGNKNSQTELEKAMQQADEENDKLGYTYDRDISEDTQKRIGSAVSAKLHGDCKNFIDKNGKQGPWARTALEEMRKKPSAYVDNEPPDVLKLCPGYKTMSKSEREGYWLWTFASLASAEASCDPKAANRKVAGNPNSPPDGDAIGLFQLGTWQCAWGNTEAKLMDPHISTRCMVARLGDELMKRDNLCGKKGQTNWGPFRCDSQHKGDSGAAAKVRSLMTQYTGCQGPFRSQ